MIMRPAMFAIAIVIVGACAALAAGPPDAVDPGWWSRVQADIGRSEYEISWQNTTALPDLPGAWQAPNREQGFRTYFTPRGIRVVPRAATDPAWEWALTFAWYGRRDLRCPAVEGSLGVRANRIDYARGGVTEWFVNDERGLEHGFVLSEPAEQAGCAPVPAGGDEPRDAESLVRVALVLSGTLAPVISGDAQAVDFRDAGGRCAVHYAQLEVRDARGTRVPAWFEGFAAAGERGIQIVLDDTDAVYPITIDPLATSPAWNVYGGQAVAHYGYSVATAGDVNGDGFSDIIVGAPRYDGGETDEGRSYVYYGSPSGPSFAASWHEESDAADDRFGYSVATAGDVNGDGYSDIVVGVPRHMTSLIAEGVAYVYYGSAAGLPHEADKVLFDRDHLARALFGASVSTAGDVNGDGYSDVIVGAPGETPAVPERAFVYHGSADGLSNIATWIVQGDQADCGFAAAVSTAGDVDGDGYSEVIVGADQYTNGNTDEGKAFVYHGSGIGLSTTPAWSAEGNADEATLGISVGAAGDVNGDGYADIIIGAIFMGEHSQGAALVYHGSDRGLSTTCSLRIDGPGLGVAYFGWSVATAGDVNADGYADVIIGEYGHTGTHTSEGATYVHLGSRTGLDPNYAWRVEGGKANAAIGTAVATAGDVNGDGYADVIVASEWYQNTLAEEGRASVYLGSPAGLATTSGWNGEGNQASAYYGYALSSAGDVNGDGYSDIAVGAYSYDNGEVNEGRVFVYHGSASGPEVTAHWTAEGNQSSAYFGYAVARAGDVNGDGYDDLVVGAQRHDGKLTDEGRVMVYHGSPSGLSASAAWYKDGGQAGAEFGGAVAGAGDVNGDGFADIIIGARLYDSEGLADSGLALVYHGSVSGLGSSAAWSMSTKQVDARL
ncbi:MAG: FG-GAP repeat protein, partial [Acidobacteria bacterium]|nr:FG-GAP repeat protein [Acidobacteriota bacterium]